MLSLFEKDRQISIALKSDSKAVKLASDDLIKNLSELSLCNNHFDYDINGKIVIETLQGEAESYKVKVDESGVSIIGGDELGTVFGIYAFAEKCLNINPLYRFNSLFPPKKESLSIENTELCSPERKVKYRGWFINDEDLLTDFKEPSGKRKIDYPYYSNVMNIDVLDMILESLLRCEMNLIIPSSFIDIRNEAERKLVDKVCERGVYISQHHVEPLGASFFGIENYMKEKGIGGEPSYIQRKDLYIEIWHEYASLWANYKDNVIWQLGLRGKADVPVWRSDPSVPHDDRSRGELISGALELQHQIIREAIGSDDFECTMTLWLESAELYGKGYLKIPDKTTVIFCDIGNNQMLGEDFYSIKRQLNTDYGIYYHSAYHSEGPHLAEACSPEKMTFNYSEAAKFNSLYYSILNVSNVREFQFSILLNAAILKDPERFKLEEYLDLYFGKYFGENKDLIKDIYKRFYECFADLGKDTLKRRMAEREYYYHDADNLPFTEYEGSDDLIRFYVTALYKLDKDRYDRSEEIKNAAERFNALAEYIDSVIERFPRDQRDHILIYPRLQALYLRDIYLWRNLARKIYFLNKEGKAYENELIEADRYIDSILENRKVAEKGYFDTWYRGDKKVGIPLLKKFIRENLHNK